MPVIPLLRVKDWDALYENNRTRGLKVMQWVPVPNKHDGDGYTALVDHPSGAAYLGCWIATLQVASRCEPRGTLLRDGGKPHTAESLARMTRLSREAFEEAIPRLLAVEWLEVIKPDTGDDVPLNSTTMRESGMTMRGSDYEGKGMELNGMEEKRICSSAEADERNPPSIDNSFPEGTPGALFPGEATKPAKANRQDLTATQETWFAGWWAIYWRRVARKPARAAFGKLIKTEGRFQEVMAATKAQSAEMLGRPPSARPHGASWLNAERWQDELETAAPNPTKYFDGAYLRRDQPTASLGRLIR